VSRRFRLALFLAALAATAPMPSARVIEAARAEAGIAWFHSDRIVSPRSEISARAVPTPLVAWIGSHTDPETALPQTLLSQSLFQRPPPSQN
jgi:hypothetical protein